MLTELPLWQLLVDFTAGLQLQELQNSIDPCLGARWHPAMRAVPSKVPAISDGQVTGLIIAASDMH